MADSKISALPASTTPLAGTEVLPIVQSSATKQVSVANLTAGRAISATQLTLTTGNLIVASGQGIDFSATSGTGTSELLADYEEGTWTAAMTGSTSGPTTPISVTGSYTKTGRIVTVNARFADVDTTGASGNLVITGLPFTPSEIYHGTAAFFNFGIDPSIAYCTTASQVLFTSITLGTNVAIVGGASRYCFFTLTYIV